MTKLAEFEEEGEGEGSEIGKTVREGGYRVKRARITAEAEATFSDSAFPFLGIEIV